VSYSQESPVIWFSKKITTSAVEFACSIFKQNWKIHIQIITGLSFSNLKTFQSTGMTMNLVEELKENLSTDTIFLLQAA
jgi:hypothetical protein